MLPQWSIYLLKGTIVRDGGEAMDPGPQLSIGHALYTLWLGNPLRDAKNRSPCHWEQKLLVAQELKGLAWEL